ncbi:hypothetical protein ABMA27_008264 [Loxostege sticticalis]|uniref:PHD finger protein 12 n=1 Tax=Loxostege sticticalis TaxID=481309 RepID=A0ABR3HAU8_LOXSC
MSNVSYDLDTSGGLMPLIRALIKPPDEDPNATKPKKPQHPYYKRPGKGHNHDSCDACGEGGDLICCDRCPASFHLGCYDPPLDENDIPAGQWLCRECRAADADKPASARGSRAHSPADSKSDTDKKTRSLRNSRANSTKKKSKDEEEEEKKKEEPEKELTPMEILVRAARIMNPRQFELPNEMKIPCIFPGTEKEGNGKNGNSSLVTVDAWGCVPLPAKLCFVCQQTCKMAPLLQCDYCPLLFHQDCLDPPLTALPTGRWMCPNHVEQYIDWKLVNSISATERVALWEQFAGPVDQHAIKTDFIRRARNPRPAFRIKVPVGIKGRVVVPAMVRHHYKHPPPLLPSRREYTRCVKALQRIKDTKDTDTPDEDDDGSKHKICLNLDCPQYSGEGPCPHDAGTPSLQPATDKDAADDLKAISEPEPKVDRNTDSSSDLSDSDFEYFTASVKRRKVTARRSPQHAKLSRLTLNADADVNELLQVVDERLDKLDSRLVRLLAWQQLQQISWGEQCIGSWSRCPVSARLSRAVRTALARHALATRGEALPSALLSAADRRRIAQAVWGRPPADPPTPPMTPTPPADAYVRATLSAIEDPALNGVGDIVGTPIAMRRSAITIGTDSSCEVRLPRGCRTVSPHHATIFMDEVTRHFELINYSEWGTVVNGVLYTCDVSAPDTAPDDDAQRLNTLRELVSRRPHHTHRINGSLTAPLEADPCRCSERPPAAGAWEGSALLAHGALLGFGCAHYVFSITDATPFPYEHMPEEPAL